MYRIGCGCARNSLVVSLARAALLGIATAFVPTFLTSLSWPSLLVPDSESARAEQILTDEFDVAPVERGALVFTATDSTFEDASYRAVVRAAAAAAAEQLTTLPSYFRLPTSNRR